MKKTILIMISALTIVLLLALFQQRGNKPAQQTEPPLLAPVEIDTAGFASALTPGGITFPDDLGSHDQYQTEWWYYTGNLVDENERPFGFQLTFFRRALTPDDSSQAVSSDGDSSQWRTNQIYLAHFTVSDIGSDHFYADERFSRGAAGLAGAEADPYHVWLEDWSAAELESGQTRLTARADGYAIDLYLSETLPPVLHGDSGLSQKGPQPGNASYYYSIPQLAVDGSIEIENETLEVTGLAWNDHEFGTSALGPDAVGWDWYSLQLDDGSALMLFEIRQKDGSISPYSSGTYIHPNGEQTALVADDWQLVVLDYWTSGASGARYPSSWRLSVPSLNLSLLGQPQMADQELNLSTTYWEGAVSFEGSRNDHPVRAQGYIEMTGYAHPMTGRF